MREYGVKTSTRKVQTSISPERVRFSLPRVAVEESARPRSNSERMMESNAIQRIVECAALFVASLERCVKAIQRPGRRPVTALDNFHIMTQRSNCSMQTVYEHAVARRIAPRVRVTNS